MKALVVAGLVGLLGCRGDTPNEERKLPQLAPGPFEIPKRLRLPVVVDGTAGKDIDAERLRARPADYREEERHAWRLDTLLAADLRTGRARISGVQESGIKLVLQLPAEKALVPVLLVNRRGQTLMTVVDPADPFPGFHGQGGRLARPGQPQPQAVVTRIEIENLP